MTTGILPRTPMHAIHEQLLKVNAEQSDRYVSDEGARKRYWAKHPTFFACIKCMDGRVLFPSMTNTPIGIVKPFRAIGGKFEMFWPSFAGRVRQWIGDAFRRGSHACIFVTYHYSAGDTHLGCAGWHYDTKAARGHAEKLAGDMAFVFGEELTAIVAGVETDRDILTLHGKNGDVSGETCVGKTEEEILTSLLIAFPEMPRTVAQDLIPFLKGNADRVTNLTDNGRSVEQKMHDERVIAIGQGFDWLAQANLALIINDADPNLDESIRVAGSLIVKNLQNAPADDHGMIFTCIPYREPGIDERQAIARANGLRTFAAKVIADAYPDLVASGRLHTLSAVMWEPSKRVKVVEAD